MLMKKTIRLFYAILAMIFIFSTVIPITIAHAAAGNDITLWNSNISTTFDANSAQV